jgi:hypothetical protein
VADSKGQQRCKQVVRRQVVGNIPLQAAHRPFAPVDAAEDHSSSRSTYGMLLGNRTWMQSLRR